MLLLSCPAAWGKSRVYSDNIQSLQVVVGQDFLSPPVMQLGSSDVLHVSFDEMSHQYHRYICRLELCDVDWQPVSSLFESDIISGFNDNPIDDYRNSEGTNIQYTHYSYQLPNDRCRLRLSGNYRLHILDDDNAQEEVAVAEFYVVQPRVLTGLSVSTNTDVDINKCSQQVSMTVRYQDLHVARPDEQIRVVVRQNNREDSERRDVPFSYSNAQGLTWEHCRQLIFPGGNEYHKFEMLDVDNPTMGLERITWDGEQYHAYPFACEQRRQYVYDEDADGAFYFRNTYNDDNDTHSDYLWVHYKLFCPLSATYGDDGRDASVIIDGQWATGDPQRYVTTYDASDKSFNVSLFQKQGYYNYQFLLQDADGRTRTLSHEGNFYQTENRYQAFVYYHELGGRSWQLVGYQQVVFRK